MNEILARAGRSFAFCAIVVLLLTTAAFSRSLDGGFVWDDHRFIEENANVVGRTPWLRLVSDAGTVDKYGAQGIVRPLRTVEFALDDAVFGLSPTAFRVHSLLWHLAGAVALLAVLRRFLGPGFPSLLGALFWAVHPVQAESAAFVSSRGDVAMGALSFAAIWLALRSNGRDKFAAASLVAAGAACLYKETGVALPLVIAALSATKFVRVRVWPYFAVAAAYLVYRSFAQSGSIESGASFVLGGSTGGTFATMARAFGFYVLEALVPSQSLDWFLPPSRGLASAAPIAWAAFHVAVVTAAVVLRARRPLFAVSVAWFYVFLLPVANWPLFTGIPTTERFMYASLGGAALLFGWGARTAGRSAVWPAAVVVLALGVGTVERCGMWRSDDALWDAVGADHESPREWQRRAKRSGFDAFALRKTALALPPGPERNDLVRRVREGFERSLEEAHHVIALSRAFEMVAESRSEVVRSADLVASNAAFVLLRNEEALFHADEALRINADEDGYGHYDRAMPLLALGFDSEAIASLLRARETGMGGPNSDVASALVRAAAAAEKDGLPATAEAAYRAALDASPTSNDALRSSAQSRLAALTARPPGEGDAAREHEAIERSNARLAALRPSCPALTTAAPPR